MNSIDEVVPEGLELMEAEPGYHVLAEDNGSDERPAVLHRLLAEGKVDP